MNNKITYLAIVLVAIFQSCSDYDQQDFTVLLPKAGEDKVLFTEEVGTSIPIDGSASSDVNGLGFDYLWEVVESPEGFDYALDNETSATPSLIVDNEVSGRYTLSLIISRGDQRAQDFVHVDVNPQNTFLLFVNAIEGNESATFNVPTVGISGNDVAPFFADDQYYVVNLNEARNSDGDVELLVEYNGNTLTVTETLTALKNYTLYLVGTVDAPELLLVEKLLNKNTLPTSFVGLDYINLAPDLSDAVLYIDATSVGFAIMPIDLLFTGLGLPDNFGSLNYKENKERFFPANSIFPLPIWATVNGVRVTNDTAINLPAGQSGNFGIFMIFQDASATDGYTLKFINKSELLPQ